MKQTINFLITSVVIALKKKKKKNLKKSKRKKQTKYIFHDNRSIKTNLIRQRLLIISITAPPIDADPTHDGERAIPPNNRYLARKISEEKPGAKGRNGG